MDGVRRAEAVGISFRCQGASGTILTRARIAMSIHQSQLYARGAVTVGRFVWKPDAAGERRASRIGATHLLVIPRHPVRITQRGAGDPFIADPACAVFYNAQTPYVAEQLVDE